jgi:hypothetical protein
MANINIIIPAAPASYDKSQWDDILRQLRLLIQQINNPGPLRATTIVLTDLPTSSTGLPSGSVWNDSGTLKIV